MLVGEVFVGRVEQVGDFRFAWEGSFELGQQSDGLVIVA